MGNIKLGNSVSHTFRQLWIIIFESGQQLAFQKTTNENEAKKNQPIIYEIILELRARGLK